MFDSIFQFSRYDPAEVVVLKRNLRFHLFDGIFFGIATCFISVQTVLPVFIQQLGGGPVAIGSVPVLWTLGTNMPQVFSLPLTHRGGPIKPALLRYALLQRMLYLTLAVVTFFAVGRMFVANTVVIMLCLLLLIAALGSAAGPPWMQIFTLTTPVMFRGRVLAVRQFFSAALGIVAGSITTLVLAEFAMPVNFSILFLLAFLFSMCSFAYLAMLREPEHAIRDEKELPLTEIVHRSAAILRSDLNFRRFLVADASMLVVMTAPAFYAVYAIGKFHLSVSAAGMFTMITMASMVGANVVVGYIVDHLGNKVNLVLYAGAMALACFVAILAPNVVIYGFVFFFMACAISIQGISRMQYVAELASDDNRPIYVSLTNTLTAPTVFIGVLAGGAINLFGYQTTLFLYGLLGLFSLYWTVRKVDEPRKKNMKM